LLTLIIVTFLAIFGQLSLMDC